MLTVIGVSEEKYIDPKTQKQYRMWDCKCECGNVISLRTSTLNGKNGPCQISCGCYKKEKARKAKFVHGDSKTRFHNIWEDMRRRCNDSSRRSYKDYGGRGIKVCDEWQNNYLSFKEWALNNGYADDLSIERIDYNKGYNPENCTWIPMPEQSKNRRMCNFITINGITHIQADWAREYGISPNCLSYRLNHGWDLEEALNTPAGKYTAGQRQKEMRDKEKEYGTGT